jgi:hypothetical protein
MKHFLYEQTRNKTDEIVEKFLQDLEDDIHDMLCDINIDSEADNYHGLDIDRDTDEEIETSIRFFPEVLSRRSQLVWDHEEDEFVEGEGEGEGEGDYPIQHLSFLRNEYGCWRCNVEAVSFIPVVARLAIELGLFEEEERGGLFLNNENVFAKSHAF